MKIIRDEQANACRFHTADKSCSYFFEISGRHATLFAENRRYINEAIKEFLFYSGFITKITDPDGNLLAEREVALKELDIAKIQPSQFYISERKLESCKKWIKSPKDIMIPVATIGGKAIALDGHTRLRAALDLGYKTAHVYLDDSGDYIDFFVAEAEKRGILRVHDIEIVTHEDYAAKWNKFCDDFFQDK